MTPLTWRITDRRTGALCGMFTGAETRPDAVAVANSIGYDVHTFGTHDVRALMPEPEYQSARQQADRTAQRRRFMGKRGKHA